MKPLLILSLALSLSACSTMTPDLAHKSGLVHCIGNSMGATMPGEQTLRLDRCAYADLKAGDIVVYFNAWTACLVCHRITRPGSLGGWITKGDANSREDRGIVTRENFYGRVNLSNLEKTKS